MSIKILSDALINKIAAGEVIERPASVVKELLENSFDADSDEVRIEIEDFGLRKIKIIDNGHGMSRDDVSLCFLRHATSKISSEADLFRINSLGFRGEALASIAAVSNLKITTKTSDESAGTFIEVEAGKIIKSESVGCSDGTIIEISDLFFNVPARKKFLKSNEIEFSQILKIVTKYTLIKNNVSIKLIHNDREIINSQKSNFLINNIISIYGAETSKNLINVDYKENEIAISGYISKPNLTRADKQDQSLYINKRFVQNSTISNAVYDACKTLLFINRHPIFILDISIFPQEIDVNCHPAKTVVRLKDESLMSGIIFNAIKDAFDKANLIPQASLEKESNSALQKSYYFANDKQSTLSISQSREIERSNLVVRESGLEYGAAASKQNLFKDFLVLGQINKTYIVSENPQGLAVFDQHAAEERVNYEKFMNELHCDAIKKQNLLTPKILELNPNQYLAANSNKNFLEKIGFNFEDFGNNSVKLIAIPEIFGKLKSTLFPDILNELTNLKEKRISQEIEEKIIRFACRASVKAGDELTAPQMKELLRKLGECENPFSCPHGRPTIINLSIADLERKFKRTGW